MYLKSKNWQKRYNSVVVILVIMLLLIPAYDFDPNINNFTQNFGKNNYLVSIFNHLRYIFFHDKIFPSVIVSKQNWLIYTGNIGDPSIIDYQNAEPFSQKQLELIREKLDRFNNQLKESGISLLFVIPPNKNSIYPEYIPKEIQKLGNLSRIDQVLEYQHSHGDVQPLDLRPILLQARHTEKVFNANDTHWNDYGAFLGYKIILQELHKEYPEINTVESSDFVFSHPIATNGDLSIILGLPDMFQEKDIILTPRSSFPISRSESGALLQTSNTSIKTPRLLVFHDSFFLKLQKWFPNSFSQITFLRMDPSLDWVETIRPNIVIIEITERSLHRLLFSEVLPP